MTVTGIGNDAVYANGYKNTKNVNGKANNKTYGSAREYGNYLIQKYDCLRNTDYPVTISGSLLQKAAGDEKTAKWLEYNLALMPGCIEKEKAAVEARGAKIISYQCVINGYDSMTSYICTTDDPDGTFAKENAEKRAEEKKEAEEKKAEEKLAEKKQAERRAEQEEQEESRYHFRMDGKDAMDLAGKTEAIFSPVASEGWEESRQSVFEARA